MEQWEFRVNLTSRLVFNMDEVDEANSFIGPGLTVIMDQEDQSAFVMSPLELSACRSWTQDPVDRRPKPITCSR